MPHAMRGGPALQQGQVQQVTSWTSMIHSFASKLLVPPPLLDDDDGFRAAPDNQEVLARLTVAGGWTRTNIILISAACAEAMLCIRRHIALAEMPLKGITAEARGAAGEDGSTVHPSTEDALPQGCTFPPLLSRLQNWMMEEGVQPPRSPFPPSLWRRMLKTHGVQFEKQGEQEWCSNVRLIEYR